jgi:hypothetical protein
MTGISLFHAHLEDLEDILITKELFAVSMSMKE